MKYLNRIKKEAAKRNIPLSQLADSIHLTEDVFKKAIRKDTLSIDQLNTICNELSINVSDIFTLENSVEIKVDNNFRFLSNKVFC